VRILIDLERRVQAEGARTYTRQQAKHNHCLSLVVTAHVRLIIPFPRSAQRHNTAASADLALPTRVLGTPNLGAAFRAGIGQLWWGVGSLGMAGDWRGAQLSLQTEKRGKN
jgi:hypothetical protein